MQNTHIPNGQILGLSTGYLPLSLRLVYFLRLAMALIIVAIVIVSTGICYNVAKRKGLWIGGWVMLGALIGPFAIPFVYLVKSKLPPAGVEES